MDREVLSWILYAFIGVFALVTSLATVFFALRAQKNASRKHAWLLENGTPGRARIVSVRDTRIRDSRDYFVLELGVQLTEPRAEKTTRTMSASVSPLDFHRVGVGEEIPVRIHPDGTSIAPDLPASRP